jgi:hypothetical protein
MVAAVARQPTTPRLCLLALVDKAVSTAVVAAGAAPGPPLEEATLEPGETVARAA